MKRPFLKASEIYHKRIVNVTSDDVMRMKTKLFHNGLDPKIIGKANFDLAASSAALCEKNREAKLGMIVNGNNGTGKTTFVEAYLEAHYPKSWIYKFDLKRPECAFQLNPENEGLPIDSSSVVFLDDWGCEAPLSCFGVKREVVFEFILYYFQRSSYPLFITTNMSGEEITQRYARQFDKVKEFLVPVKFEGDSLRPWIIPERSRDGE